MEALPEKYFNKADSILDTEETPLDNTSSIFDSINNGTVDVNKLVDENTDVSLLDTISAPKINIQEKTEEKQEQQIAGAPNKEDTQRLQGIELSLSNLDKQIKLITDSLNKENSNQDITTNNNSNESLLQNQKTKPDSNNIIEVVKKEKIFNNTNNVVNSKEFNTERLQELISTRNSLMQERQKILQSVYFNNESKENSILENNNTEEIVKNNTIENKNIIENKPPVFLKDGGIVTEPTNAIIGEAGPEAVIPLTGPNSTVNNETVTSLTNNEFLNSTINQSSESIPQEEAQGTINSQNEQGTVNVDNSTQSSVNNFNTVNEQNLPGEESVDSINVKDQSGIGELPKPQSEIAENAGSIISVLGEIREGIKKLNDGLGGNFQKLGTSLEGIKNNVINNNTYNSSNTSGAQAETQVGTKQRTPMPDYRSDLPDPGDFPPKFDLSMLGGTNLPNPQNIA